MREPRDKPPKPRSALAIMFMVLFTIAVTNYWPSSKEDQHSMDSSPAQSEEKSNEKVINPYLLAQQSWKDKQVQAISIKSAGNQIILSQDDIQIMLDALRWTDTTIAKTKATPSSKKVELHIKVGTQTILLPYDVASNAYEVDGKWYYANHHVILLMNRVLERNKKLALFDQLRQDSTKEEQLAAPNEPDEIQEEKLQVDGLNFEGWQQKLTQETALWKIPFYDNDTAQISEIINIAHEVVMLPGQIVFMDGSHQTKGGIKVGMAKNEVQRILGAKALKLQGKWSYKVGDYYIFHIYFKQDRVAFIVLTSPLV